MPSTHSAAHWIMWLAILTILPVACTVGQPDRTRESRYVKLDDGVRLAVDIWRPGSADHPAAPTVLRLTDEWRDFEMRPRPMVDRPVGWQVDTFTSAGYVLAIADRRGTGASEGRRHPVGTARDRRDGNALLDWIERQPWSDGRVVLWGDHRAGAAAEFLAAEGHRVVRGAALRFVDWDLYADWTHPGGVRNEVGLRRQALRVRALDRGDPCAFAPLDCDEVGSVFLGPRSVDDADPSARETAIAGHRPITLLELTEDVRARTDPLDDNEALTVSGDATDNLMIDDLSPHSVADDLVASDVPILTWASWWDAATADGALRRWARIRDRHPHRTIVGAWTPRGLQQASPYLRGERPADPPPETQFAEMIRFFDEVLDRRAAGPTPEMDAHVRYFEMNGAGWQTSPTWPPSEVIAQRWRTTPDRELVRDAGGAARPVEGTLRYEVDFSATTGSSNRWQARFTGAVTYGDRARADRRLLTFDSEPLSSTLRLAGHPLVVVGIATQVDDFAVHAYLEDVAPDGQVRPLTEGTVRASLADRSPGRPLGSIVGPRWLGAQDADRRDAQDRDGARAPRRTSVLRVPLRPTAVRVQAGHRIRLALAGHDAGTFERVPERGGVIWRFETGTSHIVLPVIP